MRRDQNLDLNSPSEVDALHLGTKTRELRQRRNLTLQELAGLTGLSRSLLSQIENEITTPPISTLVRIAKALRVNVGYFFREASAMQRISVVRRNQRDMPTAVPHNRPDQTGYHYHALTRPIVDQHMEPFWVEFQPRPSDDWTYYQHRGEEFIYVQEGRLKFKGAQQTIILEPGDGLYFDASIPHAARSLDDAPATAIVVIYAPDV